MYEAQNTPRKPPSKTSLRGMHRNCISMALGGRSVNRVRLSTPQNGVGGWWSSAVCASTRRKVMGATRGSKKTSPSPGRARPSK